jgi:hypothetical protein
MMAVNAQRQDTKNSAAVRVPSDYSSEQLGGMLGYGNPTLGQLGLTYTYINSEYPNRIIPGRPVGDGFWIQAVGITYEKTLGSRLTLTGQVGQTTVKREVAPPGIPLKFKSTSYNATASYRLGERITINASGSRGVRPSSRDGKLYDIVTLGDANLTYRLGSRFTIKLTEGIDKIDSNTDTAALAAGQMVVTDTRTNRTAASVTYRPNKLLTVSADVRHERRKTNLPDFNYTANRVGLSVAVGF